MERINTPTRVPDLFGPGKDGFEDTPPAATQLSGIWFNNTQETLCQAIEGQGIVLDGLNFNQLTDAINKWGTFFAIAVDNGGTFTLKDSSTLVVEADGGNGGSAISVFGAIAIQSGGVLAALSGSNVEIQSGSMLDVKSGGTFTAESGGILTTDLGAIVNFNSDVTVGVAPTDTMLVNATAVLPSIGASSLKGVLTVLGPFSGFVGEITSDPTGVIDWFGPATFNARLNVGGGISTTAGDLSQSSGDLLYNDGAGPKYVHTSASGWFKGHNQVDVAVGAPTITLDTQAVAPKTAADVDIVADLSIQRAIAGDVDIYIDEVGGAGTIGTVRTFAAPVTGTTTYLNVSFSRTRVAADTTPRVYRVTIDGLGSNVNLGGGRIVATPATG